MTELNLLTSLEKGQKVGLRDLEFNRIPDRMSEEIIQDMKDIAYRMRYFGGTIEFHQLQEAIQLMGYLLNDCYQSQHQVELLTDKRDNAENLVAERSAEVARRRNSFKVVK